MKRRRVDIQQMILESSRKNQQHWDSNQKGDRPAEAPICEAWLPEEPAKANTDQGSPKIGKINEVDLSTKIHIKTANHATCYTSSYEMHDGCQRIIGGRGTTTQLCSSHHHSVIFRCDGGKINEVDLSTKIHIKTANHATCYTSSYEMHDGCQRIIGGRGTTTQLCSSHHHSVIFRCDGSADHHRIVVFRRDNSTGHHNSHIGPFRHDDSAGRSQRAKESSSQVNQAQGSICTSNLNQISPGHGTNDLLKFASSLTHGFRNEEDDQQQLYLSSRWFAIYKQSAVGLVFMKSAAGLAMETSKVESAIRNQAEAKLNQLEHDETAETMTTSCKR
ncbi:hypothetical protein F511_15348 [Dorcoceras hygrometricum]|uniref:Uncharacterized protein n=1 Tax=Dorcoceras hygrometricum TaxID=472368 RepID=A0A2Z7BX07_9LAMI|nr:hypothetical protein F511_15348 [Dorcoceras hygrometricum]